MILRHGRFQPPKIQLSHLSVVSKAAVFGLVTQWGGALCDKTKMTAWKTTSNANINTKIGLRGHLRTEKAKCFPKFYQVEDLTKNGLEGRPVASH